MRPQRIVCLSAESADWLARIGAWDRVVGVTAFYRPAIGLAPKPRVGGFASANVDAVLSLGPDLVILFSDVQAGVAARLIAAGCTVFATNPRTLSEIEHTLAWLGWLVGEHHASEAWLRSFREQMSARAPLPRRIRVYFEEWDNPPIAGIRWISEMIERAGGRDVFADLAQHRQASARTVTWQAIKEADPEVILASWCGKPTIVEQILSRPGWDQITAVRRGAVYAVDPEFFLQPGYRLVEGLELLRRILESAAIESCGSRELGPAM